MDDVKNSNVIGHVLRGSTKGFVCGTIMQKLDAPAFGAFVEAPCGNGGRPIKVIGLIYAIEINDDPLVRQLVLADRVTQQTREDQRVNRIVPVEISIINIGYAAGKDEVRHTLPPRPPLSLEEVRLCDDGMIKTFCEERFDFFRLALGVAEVPADELLAASLMLAAEKMGKPDKRRDFLVRAGRELAKLLSQDLVRLENILKLIRP
jgi:hypothetical protein